MIKKYAVAGIVLVILGICFFVARHVRKPPLIVDSFDNVAVVNTVFPMLLTTSTERTVAVGSKPTSRFRLIDTERIDASYTVDTSGGRSDKTTRHDNVKSTLQKIRDTGTLVVGYRIGAVPFSYLLSENNTGTPIGYGIEVCQRLATQLQKDLNLPSFKINYIPVDLDERFDAIRRGKIDIECANTSITRERRENEGVAFTIPYYITGAKVLARKDMKIASLNDLANHSVAIVKNTTATTSLQKEAASRGLHMEYMDVKNRKQAFDSLERRKVDAFVQDDITLYNLRSAARDPANYEIIGEFLSTEPISIMLRGNDHAFKVATDRQMGDLIRSGELQKLYKKWFDSPIPPNGTNLGVPMNFLMRDMMRSPIDKVEKFPVD